MALGARFEGSGTRFRAFVTTARQCAVRIEHQGVVSTLDMTPMGDGYFETTAPGIGPGALYRFVIGGAHGRELPDPHARYLPRGVHGPAMVTASDFAWQHGPGIARPLEDQILYELHIGAFTPEGTYDAARKHLPELAELGITTVELMPIAAFPGSRGWGYDGVALYAPFAPYGTPDELRRFIDEAHGLGLGVFLDVVYNHLGPSGNYLAAYSSSYFSRKIRTPWGDGPNFALPEMRRYVIDNALYWLTEFRFDGLRLDAIQAIVDALPNRGKKHLLQELADEVALLEPRKILIGEDERNDPAAIRELGLDAVWSDDFHRQVHVSTTFERDGYYLGYEPGASGIARAITRGWLYEGQDYLPWKKPRGKSAGDLPAKAFVYYIQNHDQVGNRVAGDRLSDMISEEAYLAASFLLLFLPMTPLLFMGQEWGATTPFLFFTDHEKQLGERIFAGRREEFKEFRAFADERLAAEIPNPQDRDTFERSRLRWEERHHEKHGRVLAFYRELLALRRTDPVLRHASREHLRAKAHGDVLIVERWLGRAARILLVNLGDHAVPLSEIPDFDADADGAEPILTSGAPADKKLPRGAAILFRSGPWT